MTILSSDTINRLCIITPFCKKTRFQGVSYGASSAGYDIRIANKVVLEKGYTTLAVSLEHFEMPNNVIGIVHDKSTWARLGIQVQNTVIEPGWHGYLTLEITYMPVRMELPLVETIYKIQEGVGIAQVIFRYVDGYTKGYEGKYQFASNKPQEAIFDAAK